MPPEELALVFVSVCLNVLWEALDFFLKSTPNSAVPFEMPLQDPEDIFPPSY